MALNTKSKATLKKIQEDKEKGGNFLPNFKPTFDKKGNCRVFICPPAKEDEAVVTNVSVHQMFVGKNMLAKPYTSPEMFEEKDEVQSMGWKLKNKYEKSKDKKKKELFKFFLASRKNVMLVIDPDDIEAGIQKWEAPFDVAKVVLQEAEDNDGNLDFAHPETGRLLQFNKKVGDKQNPAMTTKYTAKFLTEGLDLGDIDAEKLEEMLAEVPKILGGLYRKAKKDRIEEFKEALEVRCEKAGHTLSWDKSQDEDEEDAGDDEDTSDDDEDLDDDIDDEDEEDTKKSSKKTSSKKSAKKPADDEDEDEDDSDDDEEDEEDTKKSSKKVAPKKSAKKPADDEDEDDEDSSDDEDDEDLDDDIDDDDDDEEDTKKSSKKSSKKVAPKKSAKKPADDEDEEDDDDDTIDEDGDFEIDDEEDED